MIAVWGWMAFQRVGFFVVAIFELEVPPNVRVCYLFPLFYAWERISEVLSPPLLRPTAIAPPDHPPLATPRMCLIRTCPGFCFHRFVWGVRFASVSYLAYLCIFFTLNWYFDPLTSSTTSARADAPWRNELCGHRLRGRDSHCEYSKAILPCNADRSEHAGKKIASQHTRLHRTTAVC